MACWWPYSEGATNGHQLPQMVSVVVGNKQRLAENGLPVTVRNWGKQVRRGIGHEVLHSAQVSAEGINAAIPRRRGWWSRSLGPIAVGKLRRDMFRVAAEFKDVPLSDAHVLQEAPRRVRDTCRPGAAKLDG